MYRCMPNLLCFLYTFIQFLLFFFSLFCVVFCGETETQRRHPQKTRQKKKHTKAVSHSCSLTVCLCVFLVLSNVLCVWPCGVGLVFVVLGVISEEIGVPIAQEKNATQDTQKKPKTKVVIFQSSLFKKREYETSRGVFC